MFVPKKLLAEFFLIKKILINSLSQNNCNIKSCHKQIAPLSLSNLTFQKTFQNNFLRQHYHTTFFIIKILSQNNVQAEKLCKPKCFSSRHCTKTIFLQTLFKYKISYRKVVLKQVLIYKNCPKTTFLNQNVLVHVNFSQKKFFFKVI